MSLVGVVGSAGSSVDRYSRQSDRFEQLKRPSNVMENIYNNKYKGRGSGTHFVGPDGQ